MENIQNFKNLELEFEFKYFYIDENLMQYCARHLIKSSVSSEMFFYVNPPLLATFYSGLTKIDTIYVVSEGFCFFVIKIVEIH